MAGGTRRMLATLLIASLMVSFSDGYVRDRSALRRTLSLNGSYLTRTELWFDQTLDHFSPYVAFSLSLIPVLLISCFTASAERLKFK